MHTAQGLGTIVAMRPRLSWVQSSQTVVGPARAPVLRKQKTQSPSKTTHPCAHNEFRCWLNGLVGKGGSGEVRAHIRPFGLKGCALPKRTHPPTTFEELLRAWARGTFVAMRPRLSWVQSAQTVVGPARAPVLRKQKTQSPSKITHPCAHSEFHCDFLECVYPHNEGLLAASCHGVVRRFVRHRWRVLDPHVSLSVVWFWQKLYVTVVLITFSSRVLITFSLSLSVHLHLFRNVIRTAVRCDCASYS